MKIPSNLVGLWGEVLWQQFITMDYENNTEVDCQQVGDSEPVTVVEIVSL